MTTSPKPPAPFGRPPAPSPGRAALAAALLQLAEALTRKRIARDRRPLERQLERAMAKAFRMQGRALARELRGAPRQAYPIREAASWDAWEAAWDRVALATLDTFTGPLTSAITSAVLRGARAVIASAGVDIAFDVRNKRAEAYLAANPAAEKVRGINDTSKARIRTLVDEAMREGWSYGKLAKAITDRFAQFAEGRPQEHIDSRAHLVAVTEIGEAYTAGNLMAGEECEAQGLKMRKSWATVGDDRVSAGCQANEAAGWLALDLAFPSGHQRPLRFPGCRCDLHVEPDLED